MPQYGDKWFERAERSLKFLEGLLGSCRLCPRRCGVDRTAGETGYCGGGLCVRVSSAFPHFGEESVLVGTGGSGTIFLSGCNLRCVFCQNYTLSHMMEGSEVTVGRLARMMLQLEAGGCHNVNFVTPTHWAPQIVAGLVEARRAGLELPVVYNCGGYEEEDVIRGLEGLVEIYMPDIKFLRRESALRYCNAGDYPDAVRRAVLEMHRQVGDLIIEGGTALRGLLVRHLVMPGGVGESKEILDFIHDEISASTYVNVMGQYRPLFRAGQFPEINRLPAEEEYEEVYNYACSLGLRLAR